MNITEKLKSLNLKEEDIQEITKTVEEDKNKAIDSKEIALKSKYEKEIVALKSETAAPAQSSQPASPAQSVESDLTKQLLGKFDTLVSSINSVQQENQILRTEMEIKEVFGNHLDPSKKEYVKWKISNRPADASVKSVLEDIKKNEWNVVALKQVADAPKNLNFGSVIIESDAVKAGKEKEEMLKKSEETNKALLGNFAPKNNK